MATMNNKFEVKLVANKPCVIGAQRYSEGDIVSRHRSVRNALDARKATELTKDVLAVTFPHNSQAASDYYGW